MADETKPAAPTPPAKLPPWAVRLIELGGMALALWLAARYGIVLPTPPAPMAQSPSVLVLNVGAQPAAPAPIAVGK